MSCPSKQHYYYAQHIVAYLNTTVDYGILYKKGDGVKFSAYCDASFCSDADTSRSVSGNVMLINDTAISWHSCLQSTVCLSTTESEYLSMGLVGKECLWMKYLLNEILSFDTVMDVHVGAHEQYVELQVDGKKPEQIKAGVSIYSDSKSAIQIVNDTESIKKTKHIKAIHHWIRERVQEQELSFDYVDTKDNIADIFTKALPLPKFIELRNLLGMKSLSALS